MKDETIWNACLEVMKTQEGALPIRQVAEAAKLPEKDIIASLMRCSRGGRSVAFRFPPLPEAAINRMYGGRFDEPETV